MRDFKIIALTILFVSIIKIAMSLAYTDISQGENLILTMMFVFVIYAMVKSHVR
jgi:hypothetical protein